MNVTALSTLQYYISLWITGAVYLWGQRSVFVTEESSWRENPPALVSDSYTHSHSRTRLWNSSSLSSATIIVSKERVVFSTTQIPTPPPLRTRFFTLFKKVCSFFAAFGDTPGYCNETKRHLRLEDFYVRHIHSTDFISVIKVVNISMYKYITCKGSHGVQSLEKLDEYHMLVQRAPFTLLGWWLCLVFQLLGQIWTSCDQILISDEIFLLIPQSSAITR